MEDLFLVADRYDLKELREKTLKSLLASFKTDSVIPFLFRSVRMFPELHAPVVIVVPKSCGPAISKKNIRAMYKDHLNVFDIW